MSRNPKPTRKKSSGRHAKPGAGGGRPLRGRPKVCVFCGQHATWVDYKDVTMLKRFVNARGRIKARSATGTCAQHQRDMATAVKTARELALLPYTVQTATDPRSGRNKDRRGNGSTSLNGRSFGRDESSPAPDADAQADNDHAGAATSDVGDNPITAPT